MKFIVKQANRVNQEEVNLNKNTSLILIGHKKTRNAAATNEDQSFKSGKDVAHSIKSDSFGRIPTEANKKSRQHITSPTKIAIDSSESYKNLNNDSRTVSESILTTPVSVNDHMMNFSGWRNTKPKQQSRFKFPEVSQSAEAGSKQSLILKKLKAAMQELSAPKKEESLIDSVARDLLKELGSSLEKLASDTSESMRISSEDITLARLGFKYL